MAFNSLYKPANSKHVRLKLEKSILFAVGTCRKAHILFKDTLCSSCSLQLQSHMSIIISMKSLLLTRCIPQTVQLLEIRSRSINTSISCWLKRAISCKMPLWICRQVRKLFPPLPPTPHMTLVTSFSLILYLTHLWREERGTSILYNKGFGSLVLICTY